MESKKKQNIKTSKQDKCKSTEEWYVLIFITRRGKQCSKPTFGKIFAAKMADIFNGMCTCHNYLLCRIYCCSSTKHATKPTSGRSTIIIKNTSSKIFILHKKFTSLHNDPTLFLQIRAMRFAALAADAALPNYARYESNARHGSSATHAAHGLYGTNATHATHTIDVYVAAFSADSAYESNGSSTSTVLTNEPL